jgi:putative tryptophan/tyrosine transport system substrate-binding protein
MTRPTIGLLLTLVLSLLVAPLAADAQQPTNVPRIALLSGRGAPTPAIPNANAEAFRQGLRDLGYLEGTNILVEYPYAEAQEDRIPSLVPDLVQRPVDVLVSPSIPVILAAKQATKTVPIVMVTNADPVATGIVESLARPGGNITGLTRLTRELTRKRLELLQEVVESDQTLLVNVRQSIFNAMGGRVTGAMASVSLALKRPRQYRCSARF